MLVGGVWVGCEVAEASADAEMPVLASESRPVQSIVGPSDCGAVGEVDPGVAIFCDLVQMTDCEGCAVRWYHRNLSV